MLNIVVGALGNRISGEKAGKHWLGALMMTFAIVIGSPHLLIFSPIIFGLVLLFRTVSPRPLINLIHDGSFWKGLLRSALMLPLSIGLFLMDGNIFHLKGILLFPFVAVTYYLSGKQKKVDPVELSECIVGGLIGSL